MVHLVVAGLSIFTQVARGWSFWGSEGRRFIKWHPWFGSCNPSANSAQIKPTAPVAGAAGTLRLRARAPAPAPCCPYALPPPHPIITTFIPTIPTPRSERPAQRASARLTSPVLQGQVSSHPSREAVELPQSHPLSAEGRPPQTALYLCCLHLCRSVGHLFRG